MRLPELSNAGTIVAAPSEVGATAKWELAPDVRFSLLLDQLPTTPDVTARAKPTPAYRKSQEDPEATQL